MRLSSDEAISSQASQLSSDLPQDGPIESNDVTSNPPTLVASISAGKLVHCRFHRFL